MKRFALALAFTLAAVGCHSQVPPNPNAYNCPPTSGTAYASIGTTTGALTITDTTPVAGVQYCYIVQATNGSQISLPSNTNGPLTTTGLVGSTMVTLKWTAPTNGIVPTGYTASRAVAIQTTIFAPTLTNGQVADVRPALPEYCAGGAPAKNSSNCIPASLAFASLYAPKLTAQVR